MVFVEIPISKWFGSWNMEDGSQQDTFCYISKLSAEVIYYLFSFLDARSILRCSQTCKRLYDTTKHCEPLWKGLCRRDFGLYLRFRTPFVAYLDIYRYVTMSRKILDNYLSEKFYNSGKYGVLPGWLWTWIVLNTCMPRIPQWIANHSDPYMRLKFTELPLGRVTKTWNLKSEDMAFCRPARVERGTVYYTWSHIHHAAIRKYGSKDKLVEFLLKKCSRAKKHIEKHYLLLGRPVVRPPAVAITTVSILNTYRLAGFLQSWWPMVFLLNHVVHGSGANG